MFDWIQKIRGYDRLAMELNRASNWLQDEQEAKERALDECRRLQDELKTAHRENDSLSYELSHNRAKDEKIRNLKNRLAKSKGRADRKMREEIKRQRREIEKLKAELEKAQHLELQYNMKTCRWEPVHGSIQDIQKYVPLTLVEADREC